MVQDITRNDDEVLRGINLQMIRKTLNYDILMARETEKKHTQENEKLQIADAG